MVGAEITASLVICFVDLDDGFRGVVTVEVGGHFFFLFKARVVGYDVLLSEYSELILVDVVLVISSDEIPVGLGKLCVVAHFMINIYFKIKLRSFRDMNRHP